ncbi:hypothetical protein L226DRAFT_495192 [Lentinus tigrinus ALCF2SS1-7]|uniref:F-box domain-containing protein n=1 Tax=Lentinus tigrinus ALCF2SS1-6 TaxID=1328759 RepID=A0A5C2RTN9_9APHY|nr:hypothetical protein L227DRAFT_377981 [Lentinus tigrinus ALCF2SS1-6]RPD68829.1 hypothetical protein L226DRAFT_495192 [Lentinus tigrinus ALCF2SS1-7]
MFKMRRGAQALSQTPSLFGTTTQRVLTIPELLEMIFSFSDSEDLQSSALVCKVWSEVALDIRWRNVDDLPRTLRLLAPIEQCAQGHRFCRPLEPGDWVRFMRYASRVRTLVVTPAIDKHLKGPLIFDEIGKTRTTMNLFPKLTWLTWTSEDGDRLRLSLMFMHENIKRFAVLLTPSPSYSFQIYFQEIALRMPKVTRLDLRFSFSVRDIEAGLCQLVGALPKLEDITLPKYTLTPKIIEALSRKENLGVVQFEFLKHQGGGDVADVQEWKPVLREGAFPVLYDFNVNVKLPDMLRFMNARFFPSTLRLLYVHVIEMVSPQLVRDFFLAVAEKCPHLTGLVFDYSGDPAPYVFRRAIPEDELLTWNTIRPVLKCSKLTSFQLNWASPLALSQADIEELASSWPHLEVLFLNPGPMPTAEPYPLTLHALIPFAKHCPNIRELGMYINTSDAPATPLPDPAELARLLGLTATPFPRLRHIYFGISSIADSESVALFLSQLCPLGCQVVSGVSWHDTRTIVAATPEDLQAVKILTPAIAAWYHEWVEVNHVLPLLIRLRMEEKKRRSELELEVEDLRTRYKVLEERLGMGAGALADSGCVLL